MIERLDVPARKPRPTADQIKMDLAMIAPWTKAMVGLWLDHVKHEWDEGRINRVEVQGFKDMGSIAVANDQTYLEGFYDLAPDEALLMATEIPKTCRYWSVLVTDELYGTLDWMNRFSSINGHQAILSSDGKFRAVLSAQDPGVPNWIDVGDYRRGLIQVRWNRADSAPLPQCTKINVSDVWQHMPSDTPRVSPAERDELLRIRRRGAQKRIVW
jgi:hypothetical protein